MIGLVIFNIIIGFAIFLLIMAGVDTRRDHDGITAFDITAIIITIIIAIMDCVILLGWG